MPGIDEFSKDLGLDPLQPVTTQTPPAVKEANQSDPPANEIPESKVQPPQNSQESGSITPQTQPPVSGVEGDQGAVQNESENSGQEELLDFKIPTSDISQPSQDPWLNAIQDLKAQFETPDQMRAAMAERQASDQYQSAFNFSPENQQSEQIQSQQQSLRNMEMKAIAGGVLSQEEIQSGQLSDLQLPQNTDEAAAAAIQYMATRAGMPMEESQILSELSEMSHVNKIGLISQYREQLNSSRQNALSQIVSGRESIESLKSQMAQSHLDMMKKRSEVARSHMSQMIQTNQVIPGTKTVMTKEIQEVVGYAMENPKFLQSMVFADPSGNQNIPHTISQIARLAFGGKIAKDMGLDGRNLAKQELIDQHSGIPSTNQTPGSTQVSSNQNVLAALDAFWGTGAK